jgi:hypothetical protein
MSDINIPNESVASAVVNADARVTLYHPASKIPVEIFERDAEKLLALGFRRKVSDPLAALTAALATLRGIEPALTKYVDGVTRDGVIDRSDVSAHAVLFVSIDAFSGALGELLQSIDETYPRAEASSVALSKGGDLISVDPNQIDAFKAEGWTEA